MAVDFAIIWCTAIIQQAQFTQCLQQPKQPDFHFKISGFLAAIKLTDKSGYPDSGYANPSRNATLTSECCNKSCTIVFLCFIAVVWTTLEAGMLTEDNDRAIMSFITLFLNILLGPAGRSSCVAAEHPLQLHICTSAATQMLQPRRRRLRRSLSFILQQETGNGRNQFQLCIALVYVDYHMVNKDDNIILTSRCS